MENSNINIYLRNADEEGTPADPTTPGSTPNAESPEKQKEKAGNGGFGAKAIALYIGKQSLSMVTSRVGQFARDSVIQDKVNGVLKISAYAGAMAVNPILGGLALGFDLLNSTIDWASKSNQEGNSLSIRTERAGRINRSR